MMKPFYVANELLQDNDALRHRFDQDGYLFLRQLVEPPKLLQLRKQIVDCCARHKWFKPDCDPMDAVAWTAAKGEGDEDYFKVYDDVQKLENFHALAHDEAILSVMRKLLGETAFPHPLSIARLMFPDAPEWFTPPHQDHPNNQGTERLYACWIPLSDCPIALGNLSVLAGSHRHGLLLPLEYALGPGHRQVVLNDGMQTLAWHGGDFQLGDFILFHSLTVHRSLPNETDRLRISVDYRFQREGDPLTEKCLLPHFNRSTWNEIYQNWTRDSLKYYWEKKSFPIADWINMHDLPEERLLKGAQQLLRFDRVRTDRSVKYAQTENQSSAKLDAEGMLDGIDGDRVVGWAWHPNQPARDAIVELVAGDHIVATAVASVARADLQAANKRNGVCGFEIPIETHFPVNVPMTVRIRMTDGTHILPGGPIALDGTKVAAIHALVSVPLKHPPDTVGHLDEFGPHVASGWISHSDPKKGSVSVSLYDGATQILSFVAASWRDDLAELRRGDGRCGFCFALPICLRDDEIHTIDLRITGTNTSLLGEPFTFRFAPGTAKESAQTSLGRHAIKHVVQQRPHAARQPDQNVQTQLLSDYVKAQLYRNTAWAGTPVRLAPADLINLQAILKQIRPGCIITTSSDDGLMAYLASVSERLKLESLKVVRIVPVAPGNAHPGQVHCIVGDPYHADTRAAIRRAIGAEEDVVVLFEPQDSEYLPTKSIRTYAEFVSFGSYLVFLGSVFGQPWLSESKYRHAMAIHEFIEHGSGFAIDKTMDHTMVASLCASGYLKRVGRLRAQQHDVASDLVDVEGLL